MQFKRKQANSSLVQFTENLAPFLLIAGFVMLVSFPDFSLASLTRSVPRLSITGLSANLWTEAGLSDASATVASLTCPQDFTAIPQIRFQAKTTALGSLRASFSCARLDYNSGSASPALTLRGELRGGRGARHKLSAVSAVLSRTEPARLISLFAFGERRLAHYRLSANLTQRGGSLRASSARLSRIPNRHLLSSMGTDDILPARSSSRTSLAMAAAGSSQVATLPHSLPAVSVSTDADAAWFRRYGSSSNLEIAASLAAASLLYERDLGLRIVVKRQSVITSDGLLPGTTASKLWFEYQTYLVSHPDVMNAGASSLFSGRVFYNSDGSQSSVAGLAAINTYCREPSSSLSIIRDNGSAINYLVFAHELAHNLGADHTNDDPPSLMSPWLGSSFFSAETRSAVSWHLSRYGASCLAADASRLSNSNPGLFDPLKADLSILTASLPKAVKASKAATLRLDVSNLGAALSGDGSLKVWLVSVAGKKQTTVKLGTHRLKLALAPGQKKSISASFRIPAKAAIGNYRAYLQLAASGAQKDGDTANNLFRSSRNVRISR